MSLCVFLKNRDPSLQMPHVLLVSSKIPQGDPPAPEFQRALFIPLAYWVYFFAGTVPLGICFLKTKSTPLALWGSELSPSCALCILFLGLRWFPFRHRHISLCSMMACITFLQAWPRIQIQAGKEEREKKSRRRVAVVTLGKKGKPFWGFIFSGAAGQPSKKGKKGATEQLRSWRL